MFTQVLKTIFTVSFEQFFKIAHASSNRVERFCCRTEEGEDDTSLVNTKQRSFIFFQKEQKVFPFLLYGFSQVHLQQAAFQFVSKEQDLLEEGNHEVFGIMQVGFVVHTNFLGHVNGCIGNRRITNQLNFHFCRKCI